MAKYTIAKGQNSDILLEIDGNQSICPFTPAIPIPGSMGQIQIMRMPCTSSCPHASHSGEIWLMTCSGKELKFKLDIKEDEPKLDSKIIELGHS
jgi:hypothetical protein